MTRLIATVEQRNFTVNIAEGVLYVAGSVFISGQTVLPALVSRLGGGNIAVGSVAVIVWVGLFLPQVFAARYVEALPWKKPWAIWAGTLQRMFILLLAMSVLVFGGRSPVLALVCVLVCFAFSQIGLGITTPGWFDLFAKLTPLRRRGRLIGLRNSAGGVAGFLCGLALTWILSRFAFPLNYSLAFFCAFALQISSVMVQVNLVESQPSKVVEKKPLGEYVRHLPEVFRHNKRFRWFMMMSAFLVVATMPVGFFTVYALDQFGGDESVVGRFTLAMIAVQVVSAMANGYVADHYGHRVALVCAASGMLCASAVAFFAPSLAWFTLVYVFLGVNLGSELMLRYTMSIEYGPAEQRSTYVGLMNTALAPLYLSSILGGWMSDRFGYHTVFALGAFSSLIGIMVLIFRVEDPHTPRFSARAVARVAIDGESQPAAPEKEI